MISCQEFEQRLPEIVDGGEWSAEQRAHSQTCRVCSGLVEDLRHIAQEARRLAASEEPSPRVWQELRRSLEAERLIRPQRSSFFEQLLPRWKVVLVPLAAAAVLAAVFVAYRSTSGPREVVQQAVVPQTQTADIIALDTDDLALLASVSEKSPAMRAEYEKNLKHVNAYIRDAKDTVDQNPTDAEARDQLVMAYEQKAMVYDMAMERALR
jgi:negative regulator of sigma E activity